MQPPDIQENCPYPDRQWNESTKGRRQRLRHRGSPTGRQYVVRGIAREAAVILEQFGIRAGLKEPDYHQISLEPDLPE